MCKVTVVRCNHVVLWHEAACACSSSCTLLFLDIMTESVALHQVFFCMSLVGSLGSFIQMVIWFTVIMGVGMLLLACKWKSIRLYGYITVTLMSNTICTEGIRVKMVSQSFWVILEMIWYLCSHFIILSFNERSLLLGKAVTNNGENER